jgi:cyclase
MKTSGLLGLGIAALAGLISVATPVKSQQQQPPPLVVNQLKPDVYWTQGGSGGNTGFVIGNKGVIVIDAKMTADSAKEMLAAIAKVTPKPVTHVILTHSDPDHVNGLAGFPMGLVIIAHENDKKELDAALAAGGRVAPPADHLPNMLVTKNKETLKLDGVKVELLHFAPAHTSGDLIVYLPDQKIAFGGDLLATDPGHPFVSIHLAKSGSSAGWIENMNGLIALNADSYVPGHGGVFSKADVEKLLARVQERIEKVQEMIAQGKTQDEVLAALPDVPPLASSFTATVYQEYSKH